MTSGPQNSGDVVQVLDSVELIKNLEKQETFKAYKDAVMATDPKAFIGTLKDSSLLSRLGYKQDLFLSLIQKDTFYAFRDAAARYQFEESYENKASFAMADSMLRAVREPGSFISNLVSKLPFATFFFLPVFAVFIWLVYIRKKYTYTDNLIFSFHNQSLLFILLIVSFLIDSIFNIDSSWVFILIFAFYLYKAMRKFYGQGRLKTVLKYVFLNTIFFILAGVATFILIIGGVFTY